MTWVYGWGMRTPALAFVILLSAALAAPTASAAVKHPTAKQTIRSLRAQLAREHATVLSLRRQLAAKPATVTITPAAQPTAPAAVNPSPVVAPAVSDTPATDHAVAAITDEVDYSAGILATAGIATTRDELTARAILSYVVGHISAPLYGYGIHPNMTAENALASGAGICGNAALVYAALATRLGLPVRSVQFYYGTKGDNHISDEVFYSGGWHYFDPTFGLYYTDATGGILSIDGARALTDPATALHYNDTLLWATVAAQAGLTNLVDFTAETAPDTQVDIGQAF